MAITRAQQAKQLLALGGRIGLQEGGAWCFLVTRFLEK